MVQKRHPQVAGIMLQGLNGGGEMASMNVVRECVASLADAGCVLPSWFELVDGVRPPVPEDTGDRDSPSSRPSLSVCCSSVVSTCPSPCLPVTAGVAVHSTALATTGQLARLQGCWGVGSLSRAPSPGFAEREAHACP